MEAEDSDVAPAPDRTAMIHLYRGELGRMTAYRARLDTTTNWAVVMDAGVLSLAFSGAALPHGIFAVALLLTLGFMWTEALRYRGFELSRARVRLLETGFYAEILGGEPEPKNWAARLCSSLSDPRPPMSYLHAISVRLRRAYFGLVLLIYGAWGVFLAQRGEFAEEATMGGVSGAVVLAIAALVLAALALLTFLYPVYPAEEEG